MLFRSSAPGAVMRYDIMKGAYEYCNMHGAIMRGVIMHDVMMRGVMMYGVMMYGVMMHGAIMHGFMMHYVIQGRISFQQFTHKVT